MVPLQTLQLQIFLYQVSPTGDYAFSGNVNTELCFSNFTSCVDYLFSYMVNLINISLPNLVQIGSCPFIGSENIKYMNLSSLVNASDYFMSKVEITYFEFLNLGSIGSNAFTNACDIVKNVKLPYVNEIQDFFMVNCQK